MKRIRVLVVLALLSATSMTLLLPTHAETTTRHTIVDTFAEGGGSDSEVFALPDDVVRKIVASEEVEYRSLRVRCDSYTSGPCASDSTGYSFRLYLPVCSAASTSFCVEGIQVSAGKGSPLVSGIPLGEVEGRSFDPIPAKGLPRASTPSRWEVPGVNHSAGKNTYVVKVLVDAFKTAAAKDIWIFDVSAIVEPYAVGPIVVVDGNEVCTAWRVKDVCATKVDFAPQQRVALSLRLPNTVTGWLNGRLKDASIEVTPIDGAQNKLRVEAEPVLVPEVSVTLTKSQFDALPNPSFFLPQGEIWNSVNAGNPMALEWIRQLSGVMKDTASGEHTSWAFSTIGGLYANDCFNDKTRLIGLVTTNAAVYSPGAPDFDNEFLNYKVGGLHYRPDGKSLNIGTYDLLMRSDVARCLYRFTSAPLSATVTIADDSGGEKRVETTFLDEKDGWLRLGAYGFTFSRPVLKVKLSGTRANSSSSAAKPETKAESKASKKRTDYTVKCKKGKTVKTMIVAMPNCPAGWKKV